MDIRRAETLKKDTYGSERVVGAKRTVSETMEGHLPPTPKRLS